MPLYYRLGSETPRRDGGGWGWTTPPRSTTRTCIAMCHMRPVPACCLVRRRGTAPSPLPWKPLLQHATPSARPRSHACLPLVITPSSCQDGGASPSAQAHVKTAATPQRRFGAAVREVSGSSTWFGFRVRVRVRVRVVRVRVRVRVSVSVRVRVRVRVRLGLGLG